MCLFLLSEPQFSHLGKWGEMPEVPLVRPSLWFQSLPLFPRKLPRCPATLPNSVPLSSLGGFQALLGGQ